MVCKASGLIVGKAALTSICPKRGYQAVFVGVFSLFGSPVGDARASMPQSPAETGYCLTSSSLGEH